MEGHGSCVQAGPFSGDYRVRFTHNGDESHCLSRGFGCTVGQEKRSKFPIQSIAPQNIKRVLQAQTLFNFTLELEEGPHAAIPNTICGDFFTPQAPNGRTSVRIRTCVKS